MKNNIPWIITIVLVIYIVIIHTVKDREITGSRTIKNPTPVTLFDTIYLDSITTQIVEVENPVNTELLSKYNKAIADKDSLTQISLFKEAVTERVYSESIECDNGVISVKSNVIGTLKTQNITYDFSIPETAKRSYFLGGGLLLFDDCDIFVNASMTSKSGRKIYSLGYTSDGQLMVGISIKIL